MDLAFYKRLIRLVEKSEISEFSVEEGDIKIKIVKNSPVPYYSVPQPATHKVETVHPNTIQEVSSAKQTQDLKSNNNLVEIKSPIVGTFYRSPAPEADTFVKVGDHISEGTVLCIVEAMKLMNEIESEVSGKIVQILVENGTPVEYNQPLFLIEKD